MLDTLKKSAIFGLMGTLGLGAGFGLLAGCGDDGDGGDDDDSPGDVTPSPSPEPSPSPSPEPSPSPTQSAEPVDVTFQVDVSQMADGTNLLAEVFEGETVYMVGDLAGWNPNNEDFAMSDEDTDGIWELTLTFPLETFDSVGNPFTVEVGDAIQFKFAKTTSDLNCDDDTTNDVDGNCDMWAEGEKDYKTTAELACAPAPEGAIGGLWETDADPATDGNQNNTLTIPEEDDTWTHVVDAWRGTAQSFGYVSCN